jgi:tetratricopeptide (TPR) repeat protein
LPDSTVRALKNAYNDSLRYRANYSAYFYFEETNKDTALFYANRMFLLAAKNNKKLAMADALNCKGYQLSNMGRFAEALQCLLQAFRIGKDPKNDNKSWFRNQQNTPENSRLMVLSTTHHMFSVLTLKSETKISLQ